MTVRCATFCALFALIVLLTGGLAGCANRNPWTWNTPPTRVEPSTIMRAERKTVIVVGDFADPTGAQPYARGVGRFVSQAFSRALLNDGDYDVWINPTLSREVERIIYQPASQHAADLAKARLGNEKVQYVIVGKVTDFLYTGDLPATVARRSVAPPFGRRNEAIVAIDLKIVDMRTRRVVGADHLRATVPAGGTKAQELHGAVPFDSYLFWSTPLGRASELVIRSAVSQTDSVVPPLLIDPQIERMIAWRRVSIVGGSMSGVAEGQEFYVLVPPWSQGAPIANRAANGSPDWKPVRDAHTGHPLMVRIDTVNRTHSTGWLLGERPLEVSLRGALLTTELPAESATEVEQGPLANAPAAVVQ